MLKNLKIINGDMPLDFDPLNTRYTVTVNSDVMELQFEYEAQDNDNIFIIGNMLQNSTNDVVVRVDNDGGSIDYHFTVYKEDEVSSVDKTYLESLEINTSKNDVTTYIGPLIGVICFLFIAIIFTLLFRKRKNYKK